MESMKLILLQYNQEQHKLESTLQELAKDLKWKSEDIDENVIALLIDTSLTPYIYKHLIQNLIQIIQHRQILFSIQFLQENLEFKINFYYPQNEKQIQYSVKLN
ncbi:unnamed protein product [Paramecium pentaurelia]|uniref:Uncharacterized protein n=1 Tax=Paramecium pentaurelia TaxID=43138 RepID=A0A8S1YIM5_9CILI|nr:unnamed protein product [Paramecium pentaurelia]